MRLSNMYTVAITGGIGSGKSLVSSVLREEGYSVISCDDINREMLADCGYIDKLAKLFPQYVDNNRLDKKKLRQLIAQDKESRDRLNNLAHSEIFSRLSDSLANKRIAGEKLVFAEVPLLYESGRQNDFDAVWLVISPKTQRIDRISLRDRVSETEAQAMISAQMSDEEKLSFNPAVILNNGSVLELRDKVTALLRTLEDKLID